MKRSQEELNILDEVLGITGDSSNGGMTREELRIAKLIVEAWNGFINLKPSHPNDKMEFHRGIHLLQHTLAMRVLRRDYPDYWIDKGGE